MSQPEEITRTNARLKAGQHKARIELVGEKLYLRATLPDKEVESIRRQQRIPLGLKFNQVNLMKAEAEALRLSLDLQVEAFTWEKWIPKSSIKRSQRVSVEQFRAVAERIHAKAYAKRPEAGRLRWRKLCGFILNRLPTEGEINEKVLLQVVLTWPENTATRQKAGVYLSKIAEELGIETSKLRAACKGYSTRELTPRAIPTDGAILATFASIPQPRHQYVYACCAIFGLRPHETANLTFTSPTQVEVAPDTKTGFRVVWACPSAWVESMRPHELPRPTSAARDLADSLSLVLRRLKVPWPLYHLRHAYALRLMVHGVPPEIGARLMGHSLQMHERTYKRWLHERHLNQVLGKYAL
jgi:hypothetical protein